MSDVPDPSTLDFAALLHEWQVFKRRKRLYDSAIVDELLDWIRTTYEGVWEERTRFRAEVERLGQELEQYREFARSASDVLMSAEDAAAGVRAGAEREAEKQVQDARRQADEILAEAREEKEALSGEVERLESLRSELHTTYRAFVFAALELADQHDFGDAATADPADSAISSERAGDADLDFDAVDEVDADRVDGVRAPEKAELVADR